MGIKSSKIIDYSQIDLNEIDSFSLNGLETWMYVYNVVDGDTVDVAFKIDKLKIGNCNMKNTISKVRLRLYGINTPELKPRKNIENRDEIIIKANKAKQRVEELILHKEILVKCYKNGNFGRTLATLYTPIDKHNIDKSKTDKKYFINVNELLLLEGLAVTTIDDINNMIIQR